MHGRDRVVLRWYGQDLIKCAVLFKALMFFIDYIFGKCLQKFGGDPEDLERLFERVNRSNT